MRTAGILLSILFLATPAGGDEPVLVVTDVTVIDVVAGKPVPGTTVVVRDDRIAQVGPRDQVEVPDGATVVPGTGKFLIPGLWDMHIHWYDQRYLPLFVVNGITGARVMFGGPMHHLWKESIEKGEVLGPRLSISSPIVDGPRPVWPGSIRAGNAEQGRAAVQKALDGRADFVKVYSRLPREAYFAIAKEAREKKIPFAGHVPNEVTVAEASDAGQASIEHLTRVVLECSSRREEILEMRKAANAKSGADRRQALRAADQAMVDSFDEKRAAALYARLVQNRTWQCPTLTVLSNLSRLDDPTLAQDPRLKYLPRGLQRMWDPKRDFRLKDRTPEDYAMARRTFALQRKVVGAMARAGVPILAGTDALNPYCLPGFGLHDELKLLVEAGLTPADALRSATVNAASFMGKAEELGTVADGKLGDLVLLDANPLVDIRNTTKIRAVIYQGQLIDRERIDAELRAAEERSR